MSIQPKGERVRQAIRWVSDSLKADPTKSTATLAQEAAMRFDLTPKETDELLQFYRSAPKP